ncbi:MAG: response regulator [Alphaproteobacteria bacterium]|nr:response regulator [Alphaproteobacteria bacterium]
MTNVLGDLKFVVIETNFDMRNMTLKILREAGANRLEAFSALMSAITFLREFQVDLIISEMEQTPIDGVGFAHALRSGKVKMNAKTPLLLVSATKDIDKIKEAIAAGATNIIVKPYSANDLIKKVKQTLGR